ncbi:MAG: rhomboid family intramembrane serine protease [Pseudomonadota bacterium]
MVMAPGQPPVINPLPSVVIALALAIFGIEVLFLLGERGIFGGSQAIGWRSEAIQDYAMSAGVLEFVVQRGAWLSPELLRFVTYPFVHYSFTHALFVIVFLLALGKLVGEVFGSVAMVVTFFASAIFGAFVYATLVGDTRALAGGYPAVYGLIGAYTFMLWTNYGRTGENQWRAFTLIGFLLAIQLIFGLLFGAGNDWVADISGFLMGFFISPLTAPGGVRRLRDRLRQR